MADDIPKIEHDDPKTEPSVFDLFSTIQASIDSMRTDICTHLHKVEADVSHLRSAWRTTVGEVEALKRTVGHIMATGDPVSRPPSDIELEHEARIGGMIAHLAKVERRMDRQDQALGAMVEEFGIEGKVELGRSLPPGVHRTPVLAGISRRGTMGTVAAGLAAVASAIQLALYILQGHH